MPATRHNHALLLAAPEAAALRTVRLRPAATSAAPARRLTAAAWNVERGRAVEDIARLLDAAAADVALLTEVDIGMARSHNRDTVGEIAAALGMHHAVAVEYIELGHGDARESTVYAAVPNAAGLHGNAVLSRWPITRAVVLPLDDGGDWFAGAGDPFQRRIGSRHALAVRIDAGFGPLWCVAAHFESRGTPATRAAEMARLLPDLADLACDAPVLLGGDFNTKAATPAVLTAERGADDEPLFALARTHGLMTAGANTAAISTRRRAWHTDADAPANARLDWIFVRGLSPSAPEVRPAVETAGEAISDHDLLTVEITP
ncbi:MAG: endonuclease [Acuticoccus sp.]